MTFKANRIFKDKGIPTAVDESRYYELVLNREFELLETLRDTLPELLDPQLTLLYNIKELLNFVPMTCPRYTSWEEKIIDGYWQVIKNQKYIPLGKLEINDEAKIITYNYKTISPSPLEYSLLLFLASQPGRVFSSEQIRDRINPKWLAEELSRHCRLLRCRLQKINVPKEFIATVRGFGYKLDLDSL